jgi:hypothetical protein
LPAYAEKIDPLVAKLKRNDRISDALRRDQEAVEIDQSRFKIAANDHFERTGIVGSPCPP